MRNRVAARSEPPERRYATVSASRISASAAGNGSRRRTATMSPFEPRAAARMASTRSGPSRRVTSTVFPCRAPSASSEATSAAVRRRRVQMSPRVAPEAHSLHSSTPAGAPYPAPTARSWATGSGAGKRRSRWGSGSRTTGGFHQQEALLVRWQRARELPQRGVMEHDVGWHARFPRQLRPERAQLLEHLLVVRALVLRCGWCRLPPGRGGPHLLRSGSTAAFAALAGLAPPRSVGVAEVPQEVLPAASARICEAHQAIQHLPLARDPQLQQLEVHRQIFRGDRRSGDEELPVTAEPPL